MNTDIIENEYYVFEFKSWNDKPELPDKSYVDIRYSRYIRYPRLSQVYHQKAWSANW